MGEDRRQSTLQTVRNMRESLHGNVVDEEAKLKRTAGADGQRSLSTLTELEKMVGSISIPALKNKKDHDVDLHQVLLEQQQQKQDGQTGNADSSSSLNADKSSRKPPKRWVLKNEDYASKWVESRNAQLSTETIMLLEKENEILNEKRWSRDLEEKERIGRRIANLEVQESQCVLEGQKVASARQETGRELEILRARRDMASSSVIHSSRVSNNAARVSAFLSTAQAAKLLRELVSIKRRLEAGAKAGADMDSAFSRMLLRSGAKYSSTTLQSSSSEAGSAGGQM
ncbi:hypothetical protein HDU83_003763 [Entophlyctis luteolus]|nr:hypothetical protein HDU83_003763 [Entophlyctis luteolus]KAJ3382502.1 hypothetical protein HDU84_004252 [Entophlyctis sp. JEL0112]